VKKLAVKRPTHFLGCQIATSKSVKQHKLKKRIAYLSAKEAPKKEFLSLYVPFDASMDRIVTTLKKTLKEDTKWEGEAESNLKQLIQYIKQLPAVPENGIAIFAGNYAANMYEQSHFILEEITPPEPITKYQFDASNMFQLRPLRDMLRDPKVIGVIVLDAKEATLGVVNGDRTEIVDRIKSGVPGKTGKGGQSQRRYERERDMEVTAFFHRIAEHAAEMFLVKQPITVLLLGGPGQTKNDFIKGKHLNYELDNVLLQAYDTQSADESAVKDVLCKAEELLKGMCGPEEKQLIERLQTELRKKAGLATYGLEQVMDALKKGEVEVVLVTDNVGYAEVSTICRKCGAITQQIFGSDRIEVTRKLISQPCHKCSSLDFEVTERDLVDVLEDLATQTNARVEVISSESGEKSQLAVLGGVAALLRF
jgi:peptide chain release factor subunit 1